MNETAITRFISTAFAGVDVMVASAENGAPEIAWGDTFFFYDPEHTKAAHRFPFATIVTKDYPGFDQASNLDRPGIFRLNLGVDQPTFRSVFGDESMNASHDFTAVDKLMPHPVYAAQFWISILNPSAATFDEAVKPLLAAAHGLAAGRSARRNAG